MTLRIGFIGLGEHMLRAHLKHLVVLRHLGADLVFSGAFDPNPAAFETAKQEYHVDLPSFSTADELLACGLDAVFIGSPDEFHTVQMTAAIEKGLHAFCEKPMSQSSDDIAALERCLGVAKDKELVISSCHPRRFDPPFVHLRSHLPQLEEEFGALLHFDFSFWYHEVTDEWKKNRSLLSDHFGHEIDLYRFLFGGSGLRATKIVDGYDRYEVFGSSSDGPSFRFLGSRSLSESVYQESIRLDFRRGSLFIFLNTGEALVLPSGERRKFHALDYDQRFLAVNENFLAAIAGRTKNYLSHEDLLMNNGISVSLTESGLHPS